MQDRFQENNKVIDYVVSEIEGGRLIEGSRLPSERELSDKLGTNRTSAREAISLLRGMGLVESRAGSGNYIINHAENTIKSIVDIMLKLGSISIKEIIDYRRFISRAVGTELIENGINREDEEKLENIITDMNNVSDEKFCELDKEFHLTLLNATRNKLFMTVMEPIGELYLDIIVHVITASTENDRANRVSMHDAILRSIQSKDARACSQAMKVHYDFVESKFNI